MAADRISYLRPPRVEPLAGVELLWRVVPVGADVLGFVCRVAEPRPDVTVRLLICGDCVLPLLSR